MHNHDLQKIRDRLELFKAHTDGKLEAMIAGKPYSADMADAMNITVLITESIPELLNYIEELKNPLPTPL